MISRYRRHFKNKRLFGVISWYYHIQLERYVCICVPMSVCLASRVCLSLYLCLCFCAFVPLCPSAFTYMSLSLCLYLSVSASVFLHLYVFRPLYVPTSLRARRLACVHSRISSMSVLLFFSFPFTSPPQSSWPSPFTTLSSLFLPFIAYRTVSIP